MHFCVLSWKCGLCHFSVEEEQNVLLATSTGNRVLKRVSNGCPNQVCPYCRDSTPAFPYHPQCWAILRTFLDRDSKLTFPTPPQLFRLGQALAPVLPVDDPLGHEHSLELLKHSSCGRALERIPASCCKRSKRTCNCSACFIRRLRWLPTEILSDFVAPLLTQGSFRHILPIFGETFRLLLKLQEPKRPALDFPVSCRAALFETRFDFGQESYITGIYDENVAGSSLVKSYDTPCNFIVVWLDKVGITDINFLSTDAIPSSQPKRKSRYWVYTIAVAEDWFYVRSKDVFLERITNSIKHEHHVFWDSHESPLLFKQDALKYICAPRSSGDMFLRYVSLDQTTGISVAFSSGGLLAVISHTKSQDLSVYAELETYAIWTHCPLSAEDNIREVWGVYHPMVNLRFCALVIRTQRKLVWLGPLLSPDQQPWLRMISIATNPVHALYYSDPRVSRNHIVGAIPPYVKDEQASNVEPDFPNYRTPVPGPRIRDWHYSDAPLAGVKEIQLCLDGVHCIGLRLQYEDYSATVGEFRSDKDTSQYFQEPRFIALTQEQDYFKVRITFSGEQRTNSRENEFQEMKGVIAWWYGKGTSEVTLVSA